MRSRVRFNIVMVLIIFSGGLSLLNKCEAAEDVSYEESQYYRYSLNLLPASYHHGKRGGQFNERHHGVGFSISNTNTRDTYGLMYYENSHGVDGFSLSYAHEFKKCYFQLCPGVGASWAPAYVFTGAVTPVLAWVQVRYKFITVISLPSVVTAVIISIPLNF